MESTGEIVLPAPGPLRALIITLDIRGGTAEEALYLYRDAHSAVEDALVDHFEEDVSHPDSQFERFNLCYGRLEGLDPESQQALADVPDEDDD